MKRILFLFLSLLTSFAYSTETSIYNDLKDSIIYLEHEIYIDKNKSMYPELFEIIEERSGHKILNNYLTVKSGSGFIITKDGYALTNRHVIHFKNLDLIRNNIGYDFANSFLKDHGGDFTQKRKDDFIADFCKLVELGEHRFIAILNNDEYEVDIIEVADENEPDIGLIKLKYNDPLKSFKPLKLSNTESIDDSIIGKEVYSLGFPLGSTMDLMFNDRVVTMNRGNISALRNDELSIQHNAAISSGNSGGPLVDTNGLVFGINTALITGGNSLYYSVDVGQVRSFLSKKEYNNILKWNGRIVEKKSSNINYNLQGEIESSSTLYIYTGKKSEVYIDNEYIGESPIYFNLQKQITDIKVENKTGFFNGKIRLIETGNNTTTIVPTFEEKRFTVTFNSPDGDLVKIYADDMYLGTTPLMITFNRGDYNLNFESEKYFYEDRSLNIDSKNEIISLVGHPGYKINITGIIDKTNNNLNRNKEIILGNYKSSGLKKFNFKNSMYNLSYPIGESMFIPEGNFYLTVKGIYGYENREIPISITSDETFKIQEIAGLGNLSIKGLTSNASIISNGVIINNINNNTIELPLGINNIYIMEKGFQPFEIDITVKSDNSSFITYHKKISHGRRGFIWGVSSAVLAGSGLALYSMIDSNQYALDNSNTYNEYLKVNEQLGIICSSLIISGTLAAIPAVIEFVANFNQRAKYKKIKELNSEK